jgi:hypothetical protein
MLFQHPQFLGLVEPQLQVTCSRPQSITRLVVSDIMYYDTPYHVGKRPSRALGAFGTCRSHRQAKAMPSLFIAT